jgi:hypothetical protein
MTYCDQLRNDTLLARKRENERRQHAALLSSLLHGVESARTSHSSSQLAGKEGTNDSMSMTACDSALRVELPRWQRSARWEATNDSFITAGKLAL